MGTCYIQTYNKYKYYLPTIMPYAKSLIAVQYPK